MSSSVVWVTHAVVVACCVIGLWTSRNMHAKAEADRRGELRERSVVQTPRARLLAGVDNALIGLVYYPAVAIASFFFHVPFVRTGALVAAGAAAACTLYLLYSLFFVTRMKCPNCMVAHACNLLIAGALMQLPSA